MCVPHGDGVCIDGDRLVLGDHVVVLAHLVRAADGVDLAFGHRPVRRDCGREIRYEPLVLIVVVVEIRPVQIGEYGFVGLDYPYTSTTRQSNSDLLILK